MQSCSSFDIALGLVRTGAVSLGLFTLGLASASAQSNPEKTPPVTVAVPAEPGATTASFGDWVLRCQRSGEADKAARICEVAQVIQVQGQSAPIAQFAIGRIGPAELRVTAVLPVSVAFPSSVQVQSGDKGATPVFDLPWRRCLSGGCIAEAPIKDDLLKRWRGATEPARIAFKDAAEREVAIPLSFRGLSQALDALARERA